MTHSIALTGGTGFIGSSILSQLLAAGHSVRLLARNPANISLRSSQIQIVSGDLQNRSALAELVDGAETIIHCAGRVRGRSSIEFNTDNVIATEVLLDTIKSHTHFVYISSLAAREPKLSNYAASKMQAEQVVIAHSAGNWTIVRPPAVYGVGDLELRPLFDWMRRGILWIPGNPANRFSILNVTDLARLITYIVDNSNSFLQIFEPHDGKSGGYQWPDLQAIASSVFNRKIRPYTIPRPILNTVAHTNMLFSTITNRSPMLTPGKVRELVHHDWVSDPAKSITGWQPQIDFKVGLRNLYS